VRLTDTHCHLYFRHYQNDLKGVISRAEDSGVERILVPGINLETSRLALDLADTYDLIYAAVGVHPNSANEWREDTLIRLESLVKHPKVVAVGEIGLDYYRQQAPRDLQMTALKEQVRFASEKDLPVILHVRNSSEEDRSCIVDLLSTLEKWISEDPRSNNPDFKPGVIHSFSGDIPESKQAVQAGFFLGIVGFVTYKNGKTTRDVVRANGLSRILVETDGPFITPHPFRGKRNEPAHVRYIIDKISEITGIDQELTAQQTAVNAENLFQWE
jgi:TatD DNase family protein